MSISKLISARVISVGMDDALWLVQDLMNQAKIHHKYAVDNPKNYKGLDENSGIFKLMEGSLTANWDVDWSKIDIPILIMTGHYDKVFRIPGDIDEICNTMKNIERVEFPECGHLIPMEKPNEFAEKINQFGSNIT